MAKTTTKEVEIAIPKIRIEHAEITLIGDSELIMHRWDTKVTEMMEAKQQKKAKGGRDVRNPEAEYNSSIYRRSDGSYGFPAGAFKKAAVGACRFVEGAKMTEARGAFHIDESLVKIEGTPRMRRDMVRVGMGTADIRYRAEFPQWQTSFTITYNAEALSLEQIVNLFNVAGFGVGVGDWRPEKDGSSGRFHVA